mmetsp:Transcript_32130/g.84112  ORF Transcript_32130/g.84112 Transcript_32130/m.84112 type:complete len:505 (-) Transcript_32130:1448-2962(-)
MATVDYAAIVAAREQWISEGCAALGGKNLSGGYLSPNSQVFLVVTGILIALMQPAFAMLEAGGTSSTAVTSTLFKNLVDCVVGTLAWFIFGYAFAYGGTSSQFIGMEGFISHNVNPCSYAHEFNQLTFALTASTIVSGALIGRTQISAYMVQTFVMVGWTYPLVVHWVWGPNPWLADEGYQDFAGSGVVHTVGGAAALVGAFYVGPRGTTGWEEFNPKQPGSPPHSTPLVALGATLLVVGFCAFNAGSVITVDTPQETARMGTAVFNTFVSASGGALTAVFPFRLLGRLKHWNLFTLCNGSLAGMVAICAGADNVDPWAAFVTGCVAGVVSNVMSRRLRQAGIDDPIDAVAVHLGGGVWGVLAAALFYNEESVLKANSGEGAWKRLGWAVCGIVVICAWSLFFSVLIFHTLSRLHLLRVDDNELKDGLDLVEHNSAAYVFMSYGRETKHPAGPAAMRSRGFFTGNVLTGGDIVYQPTTSTLADAGQTADLLGQKSSGSTTEVTV